MTGADRHEGPLVLERIGHLARGGRFYLCVPKRIETAKNAKDAKKEYLPTSLAYLASWRLISFGVYVTCMYIELG